MSYPINYPTPQGANVQIFQAPRIRTNLANHLNNTSWVKPQGASFVFFSLIGAGGGGGGFDGVDPGGGGGSGAVTNFMCPAFLIPDQLTVVVGDGGAGSTSSTGNAGDSTSIYYDVKAKEAYLLLNASGGSGGSTGSSGGTGGAAMTANNFTAMGFLNSALGASGDSPASTTTFLSGGLGDANYGYTDSTANINGFFQIQPIIVSTGGSYGKNGGIGSGGGGRSGGAETIGGKGGDGLVVIITW